LIGRNAAKWLAITMWLQGPALPIDTDVGPKEPVNRTA
jgi:hypothetical protein